MSNKIITNAITAVLALSVSGANAAAITGNKPATANKPGQDMMQSSPIPGMERCFGVVKSGANDCGNASHNCSGEAKLDQDKNEWIYLPTGLCKRIAGGNTQPPSES
ncbi:hypothetical protein AQUSIP_26030 [Aquicella siphonis]|uniref:Uncharacterized protein n=1 Tax=Aquicella siphonis TaxID=254247 RepID=A0A5E4PM36_9COXI|nr:DUF2282 domain-containing protein [Aquicella siphonis]VVC77276.1 hypothetical protein AQUSIP_26030 [Aquicella siphonis]